ncbi:hypothetical protein [Vallicoccus soli]|uniref:Uncharacterized protein n=1 Tax=Vallicoccus soli TaxID=2339232 RepID=A0A3A3ZL03_9ACTN|nr:hypothetical protein [Vallicoccus soli]RJK96732.1 hypothetical protein D5H78_05510 [Vallicoccus soli]
MTLPVEVGGGARGSAATYAALLRCADVLAGAGSGALGLAARLGRCAADPALLASAALVPGGAVRAQAAVAACARSVLTAGLRMQAHAAAVVAAVAAYRAADRRAVGPGELGPADRHPLRLALPAPAPPARRPRAVDGVGRTALHAALDGALDAVDLLWPGGVAGAAALVAGLYDPGAGTAGAPVRSPGAAPRGLGDLVAALAAREAAARGDRQGEVELLRVRTRGGGAVPRGPVRTAWVVLLPGTRDWQVDPRERAYLSDLRTNLDLVQGTTTATARLDGLDAALARAGVRPGEPLLLVGHSQGGLLAAAAARRWAGDPARRVTHLLTTGAPTGRADLPAGARSLALEARHDLVPRLDGARPPDARGRTTVLVGGSDPGGVAAAHALGGSYLAAARGLDGLDGPGGRGAGSVRAWVAGAHAFLAGPGEHVRVERVVVDVRNGAPRGGRR